MSPKDAEVLKVSLCASVMETGSLQMRSREHDRVRIKQGGLDTETDTHGAKGMCKHGETGGPKLPEARTEARSTLSLEALRRSHLCQQPDFGLLASSLREDTFLSSGPLSVSHHYVYPQIMRQPQNGEDRGQAENTEVHVM